MLSSPKGSHFSTCKDVSAYLMALLGYPELKPATNKYESTGQPYLSANDGDDSVSMKCTKLNFIYLNSLVLINKVCNRLYVFKIKLVQLWTRGTCIQFLLLPSPAIPVIQMM
jgi:hypothetical protein